ncbi:unnamed protein product [Trichobilharzia regenti]|nr:unnamed protein product [Trichobilharzia regenti]
MSLSLDDKLLGEKVHNYCSSSSEDEEEIEGGGEKEGTQNNTPELVNPPIIGYPNRPQGNTSCAKVNACLDTIFQEYPHVKFCRIRASDARLSYKFFATSFLQSHHGVPAILVYKNGELIGNMLNITKDLGKEFYPNDLENYLIE